MRFVMAGTPSATTTVVSTVTTTIGSVTATDATIASTIGTAIGRTRIGETKTGRTRTGTSDTAITNTATENTIEGAIGTATDPATIAMTGRAITAAANTAPRSRRGIFPRPGTAATGYRIVRLDTSPLRTSAEARLSGSVQEEGATIQ
jgi:hypothetical protein